MSKKPMRQRAWKYKPGPVPTPGQGRRGGAQNKLWVGFDERGAKATFFPRVWRYELGGSVERRATGFEAFTSKHESLGTFETLAAACMKVETNAKGR